jgi:hypothetical protein
MSAAQIRNARETDGPAVCDLIAERGSHAIR